MFKKITIFAVFSIFVSANSVAQEIRLPEKNLMSISSPKGNYIYLLSATQISDADSIVQKSTAYFTVERAKFDVNTEEIKRNVFKKVGESDLTITTKELEKIWGKGRLPEFKKIWGLQNDAQISAYFNANRNPELYPVLYDLIETKQSLGHVFLDENVKEGEVFLYVVKRVTTDNKTEDWGYSITQSKSGNYYLPYYKPLVKEVEIEDSAVTVTWKLPVPENKLNTIPIPKSNVDKDTISGLLRIQLSPTKIRAKLFVGKNDQFKLQERILPTINESNDTLMYQYRISCNPEDKIAAYLQTEDEVYNNGISSDTAYAIAVDQKTAPLIYSLRTKEIVNGIEISWDKLPNKEYIAGIEIGRFGSNDTYDSLGIVSAADTSYKDYSGVVGQTYKYQAKVVFSPMYKMEQAVPAEAMGSFTIFARPLPPSELTIENKNKLPTLTWVSSNDPSLFGAYVYRGTSPENLSVIAGPIKDNTFVDSSSSLSGRSEYFYALINQNLREDTSELSEIVKIVPEKKIDITNPSALAFYYANGKLNISWNDVRSQDNAIEQFIIQKKTEGQKTFNTIGVVDKNEFEDASVKAEIVYEYRVASLSYKGDTSEYSNVQQFVLDGKEIPQVNVFYLRNITEGIEVNWPTIAYENRARYNIYRRLATEQEFKKIGSTTSNTFSYLDKNTEENKIYVYKISVTDLKGKEGMLGKSISLRRNKK